MRDAIVVRFTNYLTPSGTVGNILQYTKSYRASTTFVTPGQLPADTQLSEVQQFILSCNIAGDIHFHNTASQTQGSQ